MQRVGADQVLGVLGDLPLGVRGQQLRADGGVQNVLKHRPGGGKGGHFRNRVDHPADQGLGNGGVHAVHAHVVAVVGTPAEGQLAQIAGAHHDTADDTGIVHENLRPFSGLRVFVGAVVDIGVVADVGKVEVHRILDIDLLAGNSQRAHQLPGVVVRPVGGAEAGHGHAADVGRRPPQLTHGLYGHQQRQRGVQSPGNADDRFRAAQNGQPLFQPRHLHVENFHATLDAVLLPRGDEGQLRQRVARAVTAKLRGVGVNKHGGMSRILLGGVLEALVFHPVGADSAKVAVAHQHIVRRDGFFRFGKEPSVLPDQALSGENQILCGLRGTGGTVGIDAVQRGRLVLHQPPAVGTFADGFVGGGEVQNHLRAVQRQKRRRRQGRPHILADLHAQQRSANAENGSRENGDRLTQKLRQILRHLRPGGKPALFVKLIIIGNVGLRHQGVNLSPGNDGGAVVHPHSRPDGQSHRRRYAGVIFCAVGNFPDTLLNSRPEGILKEQILTGIPGKRQLREQDDIRLPRIGFFNVGADILRIFRRVPHPDRRYGAGNSDKIQHRNSSRSFSEGIIPYSSRFAKRI